MPLSDVHGYSSLTFDADSPVSRKGKRTENEQRTDGHEQKQTYESQWARQVRCLVGIDADVTA